MATIVSKANLFASLDYIIEQMGGEITADVTDLKVAIEIHAKSDSDFAVLEKELKRVIETLNYKSGLLERHTSMLEMKIETVLSKRLMC